MFLDMCFSEGAVDRKYIRTASRKKNPKKKEKKDKGHSNYSHFVSRGTRDLAAGPCKIHHFGECQQAQPPHPPLQRWRREGGERRRTSPKDIIVEQGLHPHPGPMSSSSGSRSSKQRAAAAPEAMEEETVTSTTKTKKKVAPPTPNEEPETKKHRRADDGDSPPWFKFRTQSAREGQKATSFSKQKSAKTKTTTKQRKVEKQKRKQRSYFHK